MRRLTVALFLLVSLLMAVPAAAGTPDDLEGRIEPFLGEPFMEKQRLFEEQRFPNVVVTLDGTVLATWGSDEVKARRSGDGGDTWGPEIVIEEGTHGGGTLVDENTGDVLVFVHPEHPPRDTSAALRTMYRSKDGGKTWEADEDVVFHEDAKGNVPSLHMSETGITLRHGEHAGRLLRPARVYNRPRGYNTAIYSDDGGETWHPSEPFPARGTGEGAVAELADGRIYYNSRRHWAPEGTNPRRRWIAWSRDGGETWEDLLMEKVLPDGRQDRDYGCMGGLVRLPIRGRDILLFSNLDTSRSRRERVTVWLSPDGGETWPVKRLVHDGSSKYSSLAAGRPGTKSEGQVYMLFEEGGGGCQVARFNLSWVLGGTETGDGKLPDWIRGQAPGVND